jgi:hypothetical protein
MTTLKGNGTLNISISASDEKRRRIDFGDG